MLTYDTSTAQWKFDQSFCYGEFSKSNVDLNKTQLETFLKLACETIETILEHSKFEKQTLGFLQDLKTFNLEKEKHYGQALTKQIREIYNNPQNSSLIDNWLRLLRICSNPLGNEFKLNIFDTNFSDSYSNKRRDSMTFIMNSLLENACKEYEIVLDSENNTINSENEQKRKTENHVRYTHSS